MFNTRRAFALTVGLLVVTSLSSPTLRAGSIFDDNWTPPAPAKPAAPPATAGPSPTPDKTPAAPTPPTEQGKPDRPSTPTQAAPPARRAIPAPEEQAKSRKLFKEIYAKDLADRSPAARRTLAAKLLAQAATVSNSPADEFVLLAAATEAGKEGSDLGAVCKAADVMADAYEVDGLRVKSDRATKMTLRADPPAVANANCEAGLNLVDELVAAEDFQPAIRLLQLLRAAAPDADVSTQIQTRSKDVEIQRSGAEHFAAELQKLKTFPDDPEANAVVGRYLCFSKGDWPNGLQHLSKATGASNQKLRSVALLDLAGPADGAGCVAVGDAWYDLAKASKSDAASTSARASFWYGKALPNLQGLAKIRVEARMAEKLASAGWTDLLGKVNVERDLVKGKSTLEGGTLSLNARTIMKIAPKPTKAYILRIEFTRGDTSGSGPTFAIILPVADRQVALSFNPDRIGLDFLDGGHWWSGDTAREGDFGAQVKKHVVEATVWPAKPQSKIVVVVDGTPQIRWTGPSSKLTGDGFWTLNPPALGVGTYDTTMTVTGIAIREP